VLIENADPGFDWLFNLNIKGLITRFGGANSHMAIRCNELDIPAAIGVGDKIFYDLKNANHVLLDCVLKKIDIN
jgi:phosphoenolpyruvate-protein kinase (PTS system EI component)